MKKVILSVLLSMFVLCSCSAPKGDATNIDQDNSITISQDNESEIFNDIEDIDDFNEIIASNIEKLVEPVDTNGNLVTVDELMPIIEAANSNMFLIGGGGDYYSYSEDGKYRNYQGEDFYSVLYSFYDVFSEEWGIADSYITSLKCYKSNDVLLISPHDLNNYEGIDEDIFNIKGTYTAISIDGGSGANPTFISNEFEITQRTENAIVLQNTAYYSKENSNPIQVYNYKMTLENGSWKFVNFERWY